jgi:MiaB/RimO family radical SAM methylthiotransferase
VKIASGCDRRCTFCAIPRFRGAYLSRPVGEVVAEARWLVTEGVREIFLVSENTTSYGKDLGDLRLLEQLLVELSAIDGLEWIRVSYLQPAELRPSLIAAMAGTDKVLPYFDLSFQHAAPGVLRRMRRFGDPDAFLELISRIRMAAPRAGIRSNVICGFPGETDDDLSTLHDFLVAAELDAVGVFGYSDEDGTDAAGLEPKVSADQVEARRSATADLVEELTSQRAATRVGEPVRVLVEEVGSSATGRAAHQGPEVDGTVRVSDPGPVRVGEFLDATVVDSEGVDLVAEAGMAA